MGIPRNLSNLAPGASTTGVLGTSKGGTGLATVGTNGQVLQSNGTSLTWTTPSAGAMTLISTVNGGGNPFVAFTNLSNYSSYILTFDNALPTQNGNYVEITIGTGSSPTYITSGNSSVGFYQQGSSSVFGRFTANAADISGMTNGAPVYNNQGAYISGMTQIFGIADGFYPSAITEACLPNTSGAAQRNSFIGVNTSTQAAITAIKFSFSSGGISGGYFSLYGISS